MRHPRPPPLPTVIPLPHRHRGYPLEYGGTVAHGNFYQKNGKTQGAPLKKIRKLRRGYPFGRGVTGKFLGTGKTQEGVPFWKGVYGENFEEQKNTGVPFLKNGKNSGGGTLLEGGLPERFGEKKNLYYICDE